MTNNTIRSLNCYTISNIACFSYDHLYVTFSRSSSFDNVAVGITEEHRQRTENDTLITQNAVGRHREELLKFQISKKKSLFIQYFIVSMNELFTRLQVIKYCYYSCYQSINFDHLTYHNVIHWQKRHLCMYCLRQE